MINKVIFHVYHKPQNQNKPILAIQDYKQGNIVLITKINL